MKELIAACGYDCAECEAYIATQANDDEKLAAVAKKWSEQYGGEYESSMCTCDGCKTGGRLSTIHPTTCEVRICAANRGVPTCAHCEDYICKTLEGFIEFDPEIGKKLKVIRDSISN